jgi:hypothetical protein
VVFVCDRRAEERHDPIARVLIERALDAMNAFGEDLEEALPNPGPVLGSIDSERSIDPFTSAKSTVTCLRSPSRALRLLRIFSARCFGVYERGKRLLARPRRFARQQDHLVHRSVPGYASESTPCESPEPESSEESSSLLHATCRFCADRSM